MATNTELEKQVSELRAELKTLKEVLDETFRSAGLANDYWSANARRRAPSPEIVSQPEVVPTPVSPTYNAAEINALMREWFPGAPTTDQIKKLGE